MTTSAIALVGNPNVGKSVPFHRLTGAYVEVARATARFDAEIDLIDTPDVLTLPARNDDERATMRALLHEPLRTGIQVGDAKNLRRTLTLTALMAELGVPAVLALNMAGCLGIGQPCRRASYNGTPLRDADEQVRTSGARHDNNNRQ